MSGQVLVTRKVEGKSGEKTCALPLLLCCQISEAKIVERCWSGFMMIGLLRLCCVRLTRDFHRHLLCVSWGSDPIGTRLTQKARASFFSRGHAFGKVSTTEAIGLFAMLNVCSRQASGVHRCAGIAERNPGSLTS